MFSINTCACALINQYSSGLFVGYVTHGKTQLYENCFFFQIIGEKDADGFYWGECGNRSGANLIKLFTNFHKKLERLSLANLSRLG